MAYRGGWTEGRFRAEQRRNNSLPISLRYASPLEVARIIAAIDRVLRDGPSDRLPAGIEAGIAVVQLMLVTGRDLETLSELRLRSGVPSHFQCRETGFLVRYSNGHALSLPAGQSPARSQLGAAALGMLTSRDDSIVLEIGHRTANCLRRLLSPANWNISGPAPAIWLADKKLFTCSLADLEKSAVTFLTLARGWYQVIRRRRLLTFERLAATLVERITHVAGGGAPYAGIITAQPQETRKAVFYYAGWTAEDLSELHRAAVTSLGIDTFNLGVGRQLQADEERSLGSRLVVTSDQVSALRDRAKLILARDKRRRGPVPDLATLHELLLVYTWMIWAICIGGRAVMWPLIHPSQIDPHTGFGFFADKAYTPPSTSALSERTGDPDLAKAFLDYKTRLIWVPPHVYRQLRAYQRHVTQLVDHPDLPKEQQFVLQNLIAARKDRLPFFDLGPDLTVKALSPSRFQAILASDRWMWPLPMNALRHYTASSLRKLVPSEVSGALMGHWEVGAEPWSNSAALDPVIYRAHLECAFDALLPAAEWPVLHGLQQK